MSPLKLMIIILIQVIKDFKSLTVISVEYYCKVNPAWFTCLKILTAILTAWQTKFNIWFDTYDDNTVL